MRGWNEKRANRAESDNLAASVGVHVGRAVEAVRRGGKFFADNPVDVRLGELGELGGDDGITFFYDLRIHRRKYAVKVFCDLGDCVDGAHCCFADWVVICYLAALWRVIAVPISLIDDFNDIFA